jgi:hypothetical protein
MHGREGMIRINFQPYTTPQLEKIVHSRLAIASEGLGPEQHVVITNDGVKFAAMKVSSISGDARRVLDICRSVYVRCRLLQKLLISRIDKDARSSLFTWNGARLVRRT